MSKCFYVLFCLVLLSSVLFGEIAIEFDDKEWNLPEGFGALTADELKGGVCFTADANVPVGIALSEMGLDQFLNHPVRFALRGQEGQGAKLDPILPGKQKAENVIGVICDGGQVMAVCHPEELPATGIPDNASRGVMNADFIGLESFIMAIREGVKRADAADEIPRCVLVVRSKTSFGHMVRVLQLVRSAGCMSGLVRVDDGFPSLDFDLLIDPNVEPPLVKVPGAEPAGRIVVNIRQDGTLTVGGNLILVGDEDVTDYVNQERRRLEAEGLSAKLFLRGDRNSVFKYSRSVIRAAAKAGVDQVIFAVYEVSDKKPESALKIRETDIEMALPKHDDGLPKVGSEAPVLVEIAIDSKDRISILNEGGMLDVDPAVRDLPLLKTKLKDIAKAEGLQERDLRVSIFVDPLASHQRVIDVLNALAVNGVTRVTFADLETAEGDK
jgi:biopolymer transport protein ExbD